MSEYRWVCPRCGTPLQPVNKGELAWDCGCYQTSERLIIRLERVHDGGGHLEDTT
jgi:protein-arginine kinase activator protein McsA